MVDLNKADEYIRRARIDALAIERLLPSIADVPETVCDLCQQCAEKMLKQVYLDNGRIAARTHNLDDLVGEAIERDWIAATKDELKAVLFLNSYGVKSRYLTLSESEKSEAMEAVASLNSVSSMLRRSGHQFAIVQTEIGYLRDQPSSPAASKCDRRSRVQSTTPSTESIKRAMEPRSAQPPTGVSQCKHTH